MEGLFENANKQEALFQDKKKKDFKKVFKTILIVLMIIIILSGSAYGVFYYITEIRNRDLKADIIEIARSIDFNKYTDIDGLSEYFDNINENSYEFNVEVEANSHKLNNAIKDLTKNEEINIKEFKVVFDGQVDKKSNGLKTKVDLKHKDNSVIDFEISDIEERILLYGDKFFKEHIEIKKDKLKPFIIKEYGLDNSIAGTIDDFTKVSLEKNYIKEVNSILNCVIKSLPEALNILTHENFEIQRNLKVNYRNNSLSAEAYKIKLKYQQYINFIERLKSLSKVEANNISIELQDLIGKTDSMVDWITNYFVQIIGLKSNQDLDINIYKVKNNIVKVDFIKIEEGKENQLAFEIELISEKNTNEILISNDELKLKMSITKDNSKVYTKIDIDGKVPIPAALDLEENPVQEIIEEETNEETSQEEAAMSIRGKKNDFAAEVIITDPVLFDSDETPEDPDSSDTPVSSDDPNQNSGPITSQPTNPDETPDIHFVEDAELLEVDESIYTKKIDLKANLSFDRPLNNSSKMNFNIVFNSNEIELFIRASIGIQDIVKIENPMQTIKLSEMSEKTLKANMKVINETIYSRFIHSLKTANIMK